MEPKRPYTETEPEMAAETAETAETAAEAAALKKPREPFFRRRRRELSDAWREIYCNSRARRIRTWQIAVFALMIVEAAVMAIAVHPAYWIGAGLLALLCVRQLFDRRPERHSAAGVVLYGVIAVLIGIFVADEHGDHAVLIGIFVAEQVL